MNFVRLPTRNSAAYIQYVSYLHGVFLPFMCILKAWGICLTAKSKGEIKYSTFVNFSLGPDAALMAFDNTRHGR